MVANPQCAKKDSPRFRHSAISCSVSAVKGNRAYLYANRSELRGNVVIEAHQQFSPADNYVARENADKDTPKVSLQIMLGLNAVKGNVTVGAEVSSAVVKLLSVQDMPISAMSIYLSQ